MELPAINQRIRHLINIHADGKINRFAKMCGMSSAYKLNRIFLEDKRNKKVPIASIDIILEIINTIDVDVNWLITGETKTNILVNEDAAIYDTDSTSVIDSLDKFIVEVIKRETNQRFKTLETNLIKPKKQK